MGGSYLTAAEVAELFKIKVETVYDLIRRDRLPASKIGGQWRFDSEELREWFRRQREDADPDADLDAPDAHEPHGGPPR